MTCSTWWIRCDQVFTGIPFDAPCACSSSDVFNRSFCLLWFSEKPACIWECSYCYKDI